MYHVLYNIFFQRKAIFLSTLLKDQINLLYFTCLGSFLKVHEWVWCPPSSGSCPPPLLRGRMALDVCVYGGVKIINNQSMVSTFQWQLPPPPFPRVGWYCMYVFIEVWKIIYNQSKWNITGQRNYIYLWSLWHLWRLSSDNIIFDHCRPLPDFPASAGLVLEYPASARPRP